MAEWTVFWMRRQNSILRQWIGLVYVCHLKKSCLNNDLHGNERIVQYAQEFWNVIREKSEVELKETIWTLEAKCTNPNALRLIEKVVKRQVPVKLKFRGEDILGPGDRNLPKMSRTFPKMNKMYRNILKMYLILKWRWKEHRGSNVEEGIYLKNPNESLCHQKFGRKMEFVKFVLFGECSEVFARIQIRGNYSLLRVPIQGRPRSHLEDWVTRRFFYCII